MVVAGRQWFSNGEVKFPRGEEERRDGSYRTLFGPTFSHCGVIYREDNDNVRLAMRRLTAIRKPELPGYDAYLRIQQGLYVITHRGIISYLRWLFAPAFTTYLWMREECRLHYDDPHPKRRLRECAFQELWETGLIHSRLWMRSVLYKMKKNEIAKPGKYPRMIGDLGVSASLQGFRLTYYLKEAMSQVIELHGGELFFCAKPKPKALEFVFRRLIDPPRRFFFVYFSDDASLSVRMDDGTVRMFNMDISSCDSSQGDYMFQALCDVVPKSIRQDMEDLVEQCRRPIKIRSKNNPRHKVYLKPKGPRLYSGSTLTTCINNLANIFIAESVTRWGDFTEEGIIKAASLVGFIVKVEVCDTYHKLQFLKHSPVFDTRGEIRPLLNIGVLLRLSGSCHGDLPGRGPIANRARDFQASLLEGAYPHASFTLLRHLRRQSGSPVYREIAIKMLQYKVEDDDYPSYDIEDDEIYRRYSLDGDEVQELNEFAQHYGYEYHFTSSGVRKILLLDYGLDWKTSYEQVVDEHGRR